MTASELTAWRARLGWTKSEASAQLGISPNSYFAYEVGRKRVPRVVELATYTLEMEGLLKQTESGPICHSR